MNTKTKQRVDEFKAEAKDASAFDPKRWGGTAHQWLTKAEDHADVVVSDLVQIMEIVNKHPDQGKPGVVQKLSKLRDAATKLRDQIHRLRKDVI